jgi:hypothetical protein
MRWRVGGLLGPRADFVKHRIAGALALTAWIDGGAARDSVDATGARHEHEP